MHFTERLNLKLGWQTHDTQETVVLEKSATPLQYLPSWISIVQCAQTRKQQSTSKASAGRYAPYRNRPQLFRSHAWKGHVGTYA